MVVIVHLHLALVVSWSQLEVDSFYLKDHIQSTSQNIYITPLGVGQKKMKKQLAVVVVTNLV